MKSKARYFRMFVFIALLQPLLAAAHPFHWASDSIGFVGGMMHPLTGADHLLISLTMGLSTFQLDKSWRVLTPWVFAICMLIGCGLTLVATIEIAYAESIMYMAVLALVFALIFVPNIPVQFAVLLLVGVALLYGYVHAYDIWLDASSIMYTLGFALMMVVLVSTGIVGCGALKWFAVKTFLANQ